MHASRRRLLGGLVGLPVATLPGQVAAAAGATLPEALLAPLRAGGCVLLLRHAQTESGIGDPPGWRLEACATQRNLSAEGRTQAARLGATLTQAGVPLGPVRSSRWCRCLDTARLAFGRVEPWSALDSFFEDRSTAAARTEQLRTWALAFRGPANAALVTHQVNATALTGDWLAMGEMMVLRPEGGVLRLVGRFVG